MGTWFKSVAIVVATAMIGLLAVTSAPAFPKKAEFDDVVKKLEATTVPSTLHRGEEAIVQIRLELPEGAHTFPTRQADEKDSLSITKIVFEPSSEISFVGAVKNPPLAANFGSNVPPYLEGTVIWEQRILVKENANLGKAVLKIHMPAIQVCDESTCLPNANRRLEAKFSIVEGDPPAASPGANPLVVDSSESDSTPTPAEEEPKKDPKPAKKEVNLGVKLGTLDYASTKDYEASLDEIQKNLVLPKPPQSDLLSFILLGVFWGAVSLVTPCVFPMIPITVSFFLKQSDKQAHRPLVMAFIYCSTIIVVLTLAALLLLSFFRALSINPYMNFAMGGLFIFFALSLFGMYEIELPASLAQFTASKEGQGIAGTIFMALTFTILSFACVAPFLGGFGGTATTTTLVWYERALGALAFATTFASPFFVLALFPSMLKKMPKSGSWLNSVKVVMGFLELAAALKFLRLGELVVHTPTLFTYDFVLGIWVAISLLCGLYLLNVYRLPHDTPLEHLGVMRLMFSLCFISMGFYLMPALFKYNADGETQRPNGAVYAWVDSFLLPEATQAKGGLAWTGNLKQAIDDSLAYRRRTNQPEFIFIDFTGKTCTNCKINEREVFAKPEFMELFKKYKLVQLFTDEVPQVYYASSNRDKVDLDRQQADAQANLSFQDKAFDNIQLPLYVILEPLPDGTIRVVGQWDEGKINRVTEFAEFLKDPFKSQPGGMRAELGVSR